MPKSMTMTIRDSAMLEVNVLKKIPFLERSSHISTNSTVIRSKRVLLLGHLLNISSILATL